MTNVTSNREDWLMELAERVNAEVFTPAELTTAAETNAPILESLKVSVGWPSARGLSRKQPTIGQCWSTAASAGAYHEIFISPRVADPMLAAEVLVHEMCHVVAGHAAGHMHGFGRIARKVGLTGPNRATVATEALRETLGKILAEMPEFPHSQLNAEADIKKQGTRMLKAYCPCVPGDNYIMRMTRKNAERGRPNCPLCDKPMRMPGVWIDEPEPQSKRRVNAKPIPVVEPFDPTDDPDLMDKLAQLDDLDPTEDGFHDAVRKAYGFERARYIEKHDLDDYPAIDIEIIVPMIMGTY